MNLENIPEQIWKDILTGKTEKQFDFLAFKILLSRLKLQMQHDSSPQMVSRYIQDMKTFFNQNQLIPKAKRDLEKITECGM